MDVVMVTHGAAEIMHREYGIPNLGNTNLGLRKSLDARRQTLSQPYASSTR